MTESNIEQEKKPSALAIMASRLSIEPQKLLHTLKETVFKGANESELIALVIVANEYGLSPLLKEIYAFPSRGGGIVPIVSIDGWISMTNRQPNLDGLEFSFKHDDEGKIFSCTCTIYLKDRSHPVSVTEFYSECYRATEPWKQMPCRMLRHKALKEAARIAFGFSGVTDEDEARDVVRNFPPPKQVKVVAKPVFTVEEAKAKIHEIAHRADETPEKTAAELDDERIVKEYLDTLPEDHPHKKGLPTE